MSVHPFTNRASASFHDHRVGIDEGKTQLVGQKAADGGFSGAPETNEVEVHHEDGCGIAIEKQED